MINLILNAIPFFLLSIAIEFLVLRHAADDHHGRPRRGAGRLRAQGHAHEPDDGRRPRHHLLGLEARHARRLRGPVPALPAPPRPGRLVGLGAPLLLPTTSPTTPTTAPITGSGCSGRPTSSTTAPSTTTSRPRCARTGCRSRRSSSGRRSRCSVPAVDDPAGDLLEPALPVLDPHGEDQAAARLVRGVFNTPSHHRVHHGANEQYLDKNYGGILIIWDRSSAPTSPSASGSATG